MSKFDTRDFIDDDADLETIQRLIEQSMGITSEEGEAKTHTVPEPEPTIELNNSNWFEYKPINKNNKKPFTYEEFMAKVKTQVTSHESALDYIQNVAGRGMKTTFDKYEPFLTKGDFIKKILSHDITNEKFHPMITFHATTKKANAESILRYGFLLPGDRHPITGMLMPMAHGSIYGTGVYTSPHFKFASGYAHIDSGAHYMIANMIFLGRSKMYLGLCNEPGTDTLIVSGLEQIISKNKVNVVPLGLLTFK
jgi:hypothetical protein